MGKKDTIKDFLGNVADDAKIAFDELLDRPGNPEYGTRSAKQEVTRTAGPAVDAVQGVAGSAADLAALPGQVERLTETVTALLRALEHVPGVGATVKETLGANSK
jgi:hypothetical protein